MYRVKVPNRTIKRCKECGKDFESFTNKMRSFCSHTCANRHSNQKRSKELQRAITCLACKKVFYKRPSDLKIYKSDLAKNKWKYCSNACFKSRAQTVSSLKKRVWNTFSLYIRERDNWTCFTCGKVGRGRNMHAGHFISRRYNATFLDEDNVHAQCAKCNMFGNGEAHIYAEKLIALHGQEFLLDLIQRSKVTKKFTKQELLDLYERYKALNGQAQRGGDERLR